MINNRQQNGRRRGRGGNNGGGGGGGGQGQRNGNPGRPDTGNRIDNRARGNANQLYEKYRNLARDAQMSGDRVNTEYYLQFADHYFRVLSESRSRFEDQQQPPRRQSNDSFDAFDGDDDYGDEGEPIRAGEQAGDDGRNQRYEQRDTAEQQRDYRAPGEGRAQGESRVQGEARGPAEAREPRDGREQGTRGDREPRRDGNALRDADGPTVRTGAPVASDLGEQVPEHSESAPAEPRRARRPRRDRVAVNEAVEDDAPAAIEADRLPPSLTIASEPADAPVEDAAGEPKPRRRRLRTASGEATPIG